MFNTDKSMISSIFLEIPSNNLLSDLNANKNPQTVRDYQSVSVSLIEISF